jgi:hypothetical protein
MELEIKKKPRRGSSGKCWSDRGVPTAPDEWMTSLIFAGGEEMNQAYRHCPDEAVSLPSIVLPVLV